MKITIIGYGEIGKGMYEALNKFHDIDVIDPFVKKTPKRKNFTSIDVLLVAIPYSEGDFERDVKDYQKALSPKETIIISTVPVGTSRKLNAFHSPVEGKHPMLAESIRQFKRFVGGKSKLCFELFHHLPCEIELVDSPEYTEFLKLVSTTLYGVNIEFYRYVAECCESLGMNYELFNAWNTAYNELYDAIDMKWAKKYILQKPTGKKGGHCVTPNARLLNKQFPNVMVNIVSEPARLEFHEKK